jgi:hypothetical protein
MQEIGFGVFVGVLSVLGLVITILALSAGPVGAS